MIPADEIRADLERLQVIVNKTAGEREHEAMNFVTAWVRDKLEEVPAMEGRER